tara:strand:+ start:2377 stop:2862 length:486 start_codon:yes stop_codon:yes gene_type:complete
MAVAVPPTGILKFKMLRIKNGIYWQAKIHNRVPLLYYVHQASIAPTHSRLARLVLWENMMVVLVVLILAGTVRLESFLPPQALQFARTAMQIQTHLSEATRPAIASAMPGSLAPTAGRAQRASQARTRTRQGLIPVRIATREHIQQYRLQFVRVAQRIQTH